MQARLYSHFTHFEESSGEAFPSMIFNSTVDRQAEDLMFSLFVLQQASPAIWTRKAR